MKKTTPVVWVLIGLIVFLRVIFDDSEQLMYIVGIINIVALTFVICVVLEKVENKIVKPINDNKNIPKKIKQRETKKIKVVVWCQMILVALFIIAYIKWLCSYLGNDILSIITIGISIQDEDLANLFSALYKVKRR